MEEKVDVVGEILVNSLKEGSKYECILSVGRGVLINVDISVLVLKYFSAAEISPKESVNILRNQREEF